MKVYVSELPKQYLECGFCGKDEFGYWCQQSKESVVYISDETVMQKRLKSCPLLSIAEHDKQVRKEVCAKIRENSISHNNLEVDMYYVTPQQLYEIEQGEDK